MPAVRFTRVSSSSMLHLQTLLIKQQQQKKKKKKQKRNCRDLPIGQSSNKPTDYHKKFFGEFLSTKSQQVEISGGKQSVPTQTKAKVLFIVFGFYL